MATMVGLDTRATMDMDATVKGLPVTKETISEVFCNICVIHVDNDISFTFSDIDDIREDDEYGGYRVSLSVNYHPMAASIKIDIISGQIVIN